MEGKALRKKMEKTKLQKVAESVIGGKTLNKVGNRSLGCIVL